MRVPTVAAGILAIAQSACAGFTQQSPEAVPAGQLVRQVVYNELNDHQGHGYWRYWIERHRQQETRIDEQVETAEGPVTWLTLSNGRPLSAEGRQQEDARLKHLLGSAEEQARHRQEYAGDERRIGRILALLPDAFLYAYDGEENGCYRLRFHPNPDYPARSIEARIFHAMSGQLWVDARYKRLARLDGRVQDNVDFGYGILGRLYKGGWFELQRAQVSATDWKTVRLEVHMYGRALLVKSFARETSEARGGFVPVAAGMNLAQGVRLLEQVEGQTESRAALAAPTAFTARR